MDRDVTWANDRGRLLVLHYWADLQSMPGFHCYDNIALNAKCQRVVVLALCLVSLCTGNLQFSNALDLSIRLSHQASSSLCVHAHVPPPVAALVACLPASLKHIASITLTRHCVKINNVLFLLSQLSYNENRSTEKIQSERWSVKEVLRETISHS